MKRLLIIAGIALLAAGAHAADVAGLVGQLQAPDGKARAGARAGLVEAGPAAIAPLLGLVGGESRTGDREARIALTLLVQRASAAGAPAEGKAQTLAALSAALAPERSPAQRAAALELLAPVGDGKSVAAMAPLLGDPSLREDARRALVRIAAPEATTALTGALAGADAPFRAALLNGLGERHAAGALKSVLPWCEDKSETVRLAAIGALGRLGNAGAEPRLRRLLDSRSPVERAAAHAAYTNLAFSLAPTDARLAERMFVAADMSAETEAERCAALAGLSRLPRPPMDRLARALERGSAGERGAVVDSLTESPAPHLPEALAQAARKGKTPTRVALLRILRDRGDAVGRTAAAEALRSPDAEVLAAGIELLARVGTPHDATCLVEFLAGKDERVRAAARAGLVAMPGTPVTNALVPQLPLAEPTLRKEMAAILGERRDAAALAVLHLACSDKDPQVSLAAMGALGQLRYTDLNTGLVKATVSLLSAALKEGEDARRNVAARSLMHLAEAFRAGDAPRAQSLYRDVLALAPGDEERRLALAGMGRFADPATLDLLKPYLEQPNLRAAASAALAPGAGALALAGRRDEALQWYRTAARGITDRDLARDVMGKVRALGGDVDLAGEAGYVTRWFVLGPFGTRAEVEKRDMLDPSRRIDVRRPVVAGGQVQRWRFVALDDPAGLLDLEEAVARKSNVVAYAYAEVRSDTARDVVLRIGSDDSVACWLNGKKVHEFLGDRGYPGDLDRAPARLEAGTNTLLLRVGQGAAQWSAGVRITDKEGAPLRLAQKGGADAAGENGVLSTWWVLGPFPGRGALKARDAIPTDRPVDRAAKVEHEGQKLEWKMARATNADGMVDLRQAIAPAGDCGGYAYAEVTSDVERDVLLQIGSDDDVVCWVNGRKVHEALVDRPYSADQDQVKAHLKAGKNTLLLKILQGGGDWAMSLRLSGPDGLPLQVAQQAPGAFTVAAGEEAAPAKRKVLYYTRCTGFRHDVIPYSWRVLREIGRDGGAFSVTVTEEPAKITPEYLAQFDAIVLYTTGAPFPTPEAKQAFLDFVKGGKAVIGVHSALDTHYDWPAFGEMMGGWFDGHPWNQEVGIKVDDPKHAACRMLPAGWKIADEIYQFRNWSRAKVHMLLTIENASVDTKANGVKRADLDFAVAWCSEYGKGRVFFTSLGHRKSVWDDALFQEHLRAGILWSLRDAE